MRHLGFLLSLLMLLAGCSGGPDTQALRRDVEVRVAQALPGEALVLQDLQRRGSQRDQKAPEGESRRIVYYDASFRVQKDMDFGAWDAPGMAGLVSALGAGPKGVGGVQSGGNKAGDIVRAHGTALYKREADHWVAVAGAGFRPKEAPAYATNTATGPAAILDAMRKVIDSVSKETSPAQMAIIEEELTAAQASIRARLARASAGYAIAAGPEHGQYLRFARALDEPGGPRTLPLVTFGGEENLDLLREGKVQVALAQADSALAAYEGTGPFQARGAAPALRALGSLYPEAVHVIVRADSGLAAVASLRGRVVAIGQPGAASRTTVLRVLEAHGLTPRDIQAREIGLADALVALGRKEVDAVLQVIGIPADSVRDALTNVPLKLLPLSDSAIAQLTAGRTGLFAYAIPAGSYPRQGAGVNTVATAAVLLVGADLSEAEVGALTSFVFRKGRDFAARGSAQGLQVSAATARQGLTVPLHTAAARVLAPTAQPAASAPR
ncbi:TAXI family TRAP transporter solute-binding subunit [Ramlibacter solisilvae]|uniref:Glutamate permease n=2 Tax=Ramlibacter tataouinensis TaxID=94132 RepID=A0A127K1S2_9BURK|nr:glutamate permease [Ramlibacter tataouinensis]